MLDRVPAPGKANRIRILQDDGTAIEGLMSYADDATQEGSPYTKGNVLPDAVCSILSLESNTAQPRDAFRTLAFNANAGWVKLQEYATAGSGQWTAPDLFDGEDYIIGVLVIGAGGGGGAAVYYAFSSSDNVGLAASGGASGKLKSFIMTVTPGQQIPYVVGAGGAGGTCFWEAYATGRDETALGNNGGSSVFNGVGSEGGGGGHASYDESGNSPNYDCTGAVGGQCSAYVGNSSSADRINGKCGGVFILVNSWSSINIPSGYRAADTWNPFESRFMLCSGGGSRSEVGNYGEGNYEGQGGNDGAAQLAGHGESHGGNGTARTLQGTSGTLTGNPGVGPGNGGGGTTYLSGTGGDSGRMTATGGKGADGAIWIYIQGKKEETA